MLKKSYSSTRKYCRVTFRVPADFNAERASLCGDFNDWDQNAKPMRRLKKGGFSATVSLPAKQSYNFRYLLDGERWENDPEANGYAPNEFGGENSVVEI